MTPHDFQCRFFYFKFKSIYSCYSVHLWDSFKLCSANVECLQTTDHMPILAKMNRIQFCKVIKHPRNSKMFLWSRIIIHAVLVYFNLKYLQGSHSVGFLNTKFFVFQILQKPSSKVTPFSNIVIKKIFFRKTDIQWTY